MKDVKYKYIENVAVGESFKFIGEFYTRVGLAYTTARTEEVTLMPPFHNHILAMNHLTRALILIDGSLTTPS